MCLLQHTAGQTGNDRDTLVFPGNWQRTRLLFARFSPEIRSCASSIVEAYDTLRGSIPSLFIREISVVRLTPSRWAAPLGPATRPLVSLSTRRMSARSLDSPGVGTDMEPPRRFSSETGTSRAVL